MVEGENFPFPRTLLDFPIHATARLSGAFIRIHKLIVRFVRRRFKLLFESLSNLVTDQVSPLLRMGKFPVLLMQPLNPKFFFTADIVQATETP